MEYNDPKEQIDPQKVERVVGTALRVLLAVTLVVMIGLTVAYWAMK